ncbi:probable G-protein coupled receptor Mth-like 1 [Culicoides brevitarsis]|uniref:probable G-protein coupled receptor Mth-like 1 n=1 Tax=Culicoides brevitarsis TaxID=469753 RepID=UPI00307B97B8
MELARKKCKRVLIVFLIVVTSCFVVDTAAAVKEKKVYVRKCCRIGEYFDAKTYGCLPSLDGDPKKIHLPKIYLIQRKDLWNNSETLPKHMTLLEDERPATCHTPIVLSKDYLLLSNGSLALHSLNAWIQPEDFCVDRDLALVCTREAKDPANLSRKPRTDALRKCCAPNMVYVSMNKTCAFLPDVKPMVFESDMYDLIYTFPECTENIYAIIGEFDGRNLINNTKLGYKIHGDQILTSQQFCVESTYQDAVLQKNHLFTCSEHVSVALEEKTMDDMQTRFAIYSVGLFISAGFLAATLIIGFLTPSNHHIMHWKCQTYYIACLLVGEILLAATQLMKSGTGGWGCFTMAICMHFFFLAAFFWLNTMCFNIWWTFRDLRPTSMERRQENFRLHLYNIYAWGFPTIITGIGLILDSLKANNVIRPHFAEQKCWFSGESEIFVYFFLPIGILLCINLLLFAITTRQLTCGLWKRDDVKSTTERAALGRVCMKLVIVMGITWIADVLSWAIGGPHHIWYVTDIINALQGVFIFIVVASQPQVQIALRRLCCAKSRKAATNTTNGPQHSSSSHGLPSVNEASTQHTNTNSKVPNETAC